MSVLQRVARGCTNWPQGCKCRRVLGRGDGRSLVTLGCARRSNDALLSRPAPVTLRPSRRLGCVSSVRFEAPRLLVCITLCQMIRWPSVTCTHSTWPSALPFYPALTITHTLYCKFTGKHKEKNTDHFCDLATASFFNSGLVTFSGLVLTVLLCLLSSVECTLVAIKKDARHNGNPHDACSSCHHVHESSNVATHTCQTWNAAKKHPAAQHQQWTEAWWVECAALVIIYQPHTHNSQIRRLKNMNWLIVVCTVF